MTDVHELLAKRKAIAVIWTINDVMDERPDLAEEQAWVVLQKVEKCHDCTVGITWAFIARIATELYGPEPETDDE